MSGSTTACFCTGACKKPPYTCGAINSKMIYEIHRESLTAPYQPPMYYEFGWKCPSCNKIHAPHIRECYNCNETFITC